MGWVCDDDDDDGWLGWLLNVFCGRLDGCDDDSRISWNAWLNGFMQDERSLDRCVFFRLAGLDLLLSRFSFLDGKTPRMPKLSSFVLHG